MTRAKAIPALLVFALACLFALSAALPSTLSQSESAKTEPNVPRTLLGKPYQRRWASQGRMPSCWTVAITDHNDADRDANADLDHALVHEAQIWNGGWTQTKMNTKPRVPVPLPLVLNTLSESGPACLRLIRSKRPIQHSPCADDARSDGTNPRDEVEQVQSPDVSGPEKKQRLREVLVPVRRSKRLYDRGEWKSRLFEEY